MGSFEGLKTNDEAIWDEIYVKERFMPGWSTTEADPNLVRMARECAASRGGGEFAVLDIGCGNGRNSAVVEALDGVDVSYVGLDFAPSAVEHCKATYRGRKEFVVADMTAKEPPLARKFDFIMDCGCFHAIPPESRAAYVRTLRSLAKDTTTVAIAAWYRADKARSRDEALYFPYLYLKEWFFDSSDMDEIFNPWFSARGEFVDRAMYDGVNEGFAYFTLAMAPRM